MQKNKTIKRRFSFLTIILLFCTLYIGINATYNVVKLVSYQIKLSELQMAYNSEQIRHEKLQTEIASFKSPEAQEAFLRNNFKMAKKGEIRVDLIEADEPQEHKCYYRY